MGAILNNWFVKWVLAPVVMLCALTGAIYAYFQHEYPTCTFRYKLTAEVQTPDGVKTGSSVVEVSYPSPPIIKTDGRLVGNWLTGEATYVDLGQGKNLFITLGTLDSGRNDEQTNRRIGYGVLNETVDASPLKGSLNNIWLPINLFKLGRTKQNEREMCQKVSALYGFQPTPVELNSLPTMVTFSDLQKPLTAKAIDPNDLVATFGPGYSLSVKLQITDEPVSMRIVQVLPWIKIDDRNGKEINRLTRRSFYHLDSPTEESYFGRF